MDPLGAFSPGCRRAWIASGWRQPDPGLDAFLAAALQWKACSRIARLGLREFSSGIHPRVASCSCRPAAALPIGPGASDKRGRDPVLRRWTAAMERASHVHEEDVRTVF